MPGEVDWPQMLAIVYRQDSGRVLATLIRLLGSFDLAEEALHDAFAAAAEQWPKRGLPQSPWRWLVSAGRFRTIDRIRKRARVDASTPELVLRMDTETSPPNLGDSETIEDDTLRLIFVCCHPELPPDAQAALTLREVCGLTTEEIAAAFLSTPPTIAQRIVRAKGRIRDAALPYEVPARADLPARLEPVLQVIYLIFNQGYSATGADPRTDLAVEAIRLGRRLAELLDDTEVLGLLALMLLQESRRGARVNSEGELIPVDQQDRTNWDHVQIAEGLALLDRIHARREYGRHGLQAMIAAEHVKAAAGAPPNWQRIIEFYDLLRVADPSAVVDLNRAVAISKRDGAAAGLQLVEAAFSTGKLVAYQPAYAALADMLRQLDRSDDARAAYRQAIALTSQEAERQFLSRRLAELDQLQGVASSAEISSTSDS